MRRIQLPLAEIARRYIEGESAHALGSAYGVSEGTVLQRLRTAGIKRRRPGGQQGNRNAVGNKSTRGRHRRGGPLHITSHGYLGTLDRDGTPCRIHRGCWEASNGTIPSGLIIHHINGDPRDNHVKNLACLTQAEHRRVHAGR